MTYEIELIAFKESGKYYSNYSIKTDSKFMFEIFDEVKAARTAGLIPTSFHYLVTGKSTNGEDLPNGYPGLVLLEGK